MAETQKFFNHLSTLIFLVCAVYFKWSVSAYTLLHKNKSADSNDLPEYHQVIFVPLVTGAVCYIYKKAVIHIMSPAFLLIVKDQHDKNLANARAEKASIAFAKTCYYVCNSIWAYGLIKNTNFLPWYLGGSGSIENCFENAPLTPQIDGLLNYSLVSMGYHLGELIEHWTIREKGNDYWEMTAHHVLTVALFGGMIVQNFIRIGVVVSFVHQASDIFSSSSRVLSHTTLSKLTSVWFLGGTMTAWPYLRNFAMPLLTYSAWTMANYSAPFESYYSLHYTLAFFLTVLSVMHVYWTILFFKLINRYFESVATEDI